jgi:hypothetical protein
MEGESKGKSQKRQQSMEWILIDLISQMNRTSQGQNANLGRLRDRQSR